MSIQKIAYIKREQKIFSSFVSFYKEKKSKKIKDNYLKLQKQEKILKNSGLFLKKEYTKKNVSKQTSPKLLWYEEE